MTRLAALGLCVIGAAAVWFDPSGDTRQGAQAVAVLTIASVGALLAGRGLFRRVIAVVVTLAGVALLFGGSIAAMAGGALVIAGGVLAVRTCGSWPVMGARYERAATAERENTDLWAALDRGDDPTAR